MEDANILQQLMDYLGVAGMGSGGYAVWQTQRNKDDLTKVTSKVEEVDKKSDISANDVNQKLNDFMLHVARTSATKDDLKAAQDLTNKQLETISSKLDRLSEKLHTGV